MSAARARNKKRQPTAPAAPPRGKGGDARTGLDRWLQPVVIAVGLTALAPYTPAGLLPMTSPYATRFAALLIAVIVWLIVWAWRPLDFAPRRRVHLAAGLVAAVATLAALFAPVPGQALTWGAESGLMGLPTWLALLAIFSFASSVRLTEEVRIASTLALGWGLLAAVLVVVERASGSHLAGGFGNADYVVAVLLTLLGVAAGTAAAASQSTHRIAAWSIAGIFAVAIVAADTTTGIIGLIVLAILFALLAEDLGAPHSYAPMLRRVALVAAAALVVVAAIVALSLASDSVLPTGFDKAVEARVLVPSAVTRLEMWKAAGGVVADRPLLGVGPDGMQLASQSYLSPRALAVEGGLAGDVRTLIRDPHSLPLLVLVSMGVLGFAALVWLAFEWVRALAGVATPRSLTREPQRAGSGDEAQRAIAPWRLGLGVGVIGYLVAMLFVPWPIAIGPLVPLFAGLAIAPGATARQQGPAQSSARQGVTATEDAAASVSGLGAAWPAIRWVLAAAFAITAAVLAFAAIQGDALISQARDQRDPMAAQLLYQRAAAVQPTRAYPVYEGLYAQGFLAADGAVDIRAYQQAVDGASAELRANGGYLANLVQTSLDQAYLTGRTDLEWERETIAVALDRAPKHPDVLLEAAHLELLSGNLDEAGRILDGLEPVIAASERYRLYRLYEARLTGDPKAAELESALQESAGPAVKRLIPEVARTGS